jgi:menaquinone-9 beta-reductase
MSADRLAAAAERPFDVAISGAGPAGASLALRLARKGMRVALLDRASFPRDKLCGEFLSPEAWGALERLGLGDLPDRLGHRPIVRGRLSTPRGRVIDAELAAADRPGIGLSRSALDSALVLAARRAGAEVFTAARVGGPLLRGGRVVGLRAPEPPRGTIAIEATVTIAADGRHSSLVRQTGTTRGRSRSRLVGIKRHLIVDDSGAAEPEGSVGLHLVAGGYGGACRVDDGLTNFCALIPESALRGRGADLDDVARGVFSGNPILSRLLEAASPAGPWKTVSGVRVEESAPSVEGILYAGDCQGTVDPLGGQGMTMALLGSELLAHFVEEALSSGRGADVPLQRAYRAAWHRRFDRRIRLCRLFHHLLVRPALVDGAAAFRRLAPRLLSSGFLMTRDPGWAASP